MDENDQRPNEADPIAELFEAHEKTVKELTELYVESIKVDGSLSPEQNLTLQKRRRGKDLLYEEFEFQAKERTPHVEERIARIVNISRLSHFSGFEKNLRRKYFAMNPYKLRAIALGSFDQSSEFTTFSGERIPGLTFEEFSIAVEVCWECMTQDIADRKYAKEDYTQAGSLKFVEEE